MDHYIVKIYRKAPQTPRQVVGTVENVADGQSHAFHNADELLAILAALPEEAPRDEPPKPR